MRSSSSYLNRTFVPEQIWFTDESRSCVWRNHGHQWLYRRPREHYEPANFVECRTGPTPDFMPLSQDVPNKVFQQDNSRPHIVRRTFNSLTGFDILHWPANSSELSYQTPVVFI
ncbi:hypothetical protein TNCV_4672581 [Trichonephila clavipes]|nr:hypothetical protein TNCV_4672581 [Trichonephila clavipes]